VHGPPPDGAGRRIFAGRVFAEHVFTRPFADPSRRKVTRFEAPGVPEIPETKYAWRAPGELLQIPRGAVALDDLSFESEPFSFGLDHTDSNQHVNSLVYPRLFREAALRRLTRIGRGCALLARFQETAFRKPCFAGEKVRVAVRTFEVDGTLGAVCALIDERLVSAATAEITTRGNAFGVVLFAP
jgi:hypothetical protein